MSESPDEEGSKEWGVSAGWVEGVLAAHHGLPSVKVTDLQVSPGAEPQDAVLSDILAVKVTYTAPSLPAPATLDLILKLLPQDPFSRFFVTEAQFDLREIKFYTKVVPDLHDFQKELLAEGAARVELPIPKCYHARYPSGDESPVESVLVLENMKPKGYRVVEFSAGLNRAQAESALAALAKLHGLSLVYKIKHGVPLNTKYPFLFQTARATDSYQQLVERGLPALSQFLEERDGSLGVMEALDALKPDTKELIAALLAPQEPMALITHTDFWCNNLLFDEDDDCKVLDWQMVTYSRPTNDVALLLVSSLPTGLRRTASQALLTVYWNHLCRLTASLGVDIESDLGYTRANLGKDFKRSQLLAVLLCIGSVDVALGNPVTEQRLFELLSDLYEDGVLSKDLVDY